MRFLKTPWRAILLAAVLVLPALHVFSQQLPSAVNTAASFFDGLITSTIGYDTATPFSPHELVVSANLPGQNSWQLRNTSKNGFSAISFRGTNPWDSNPNAIYERGAVGWSNSGIFAIEMSSFDNTYDPGKPPARGTIQQSGAIDPSGGTAVTCNFTHGNPVITCASAVPASGFTHVFSFNLPTGTTLISGAGTTTPTLSQAPLFDQVGALVRFWSPMWTQRVVFDFSNDDVVSFYDWDLSLNTQWSRLSHTFQMAEGVKFATRQVNTGSFDRATLKDHFVNWNSATAAGKGEAIPACTPAIAGFELIFADEAGTAGAYPITITPDAGQINYSPSYPINGTTTGHSARLECDGVQNWVLY